MQVLPGNTDHKLACKLAPSQPAHLKTVSLIYGTREVFIPGTGLGILKQDQKYEAKTFFLFCFV